MMKTVNRHITIVEQEDGTFKLDTDMPIIPVEIAQTIVDELQKRMIEKKLPDLSQEKIDNSAKTFIEPVVKENESLKLKVILLWIANIALLLLILFK